ncbi:peptide ABC transporter substrate-binding protein [Marinobacter sp. HL-58]|uniref:peptide ABC transporter substrate-binding protein n=1 Tax=Marinobacter sp. HL-58 TaxID=1479237 RepID=UPI0006DA62CA|nr:peptide ABC transporter substrate-binding protein [Marinobacter sp. HL-58]KPP98189.1 MAG: ABC-type oligopeptide uptake system substrate-binding component OppA [Marinobacter sp. HL-58]
MTANCLPTDTLSQLPPMEAGAGRCIAATIVFLAIIMLAGCGESGQEEAGDEALAAADIDVPDTLLREHPVTGEKLARKQVLVRGNASEPASLDPHLVEDTVGGAIVVDLFEGLTRSGPDGDTEPALARSWSASDNNLTWTFRLREDGRWSDGSTVTAHDFVYGWQRAVDPQVGSNYAYYIESAGVKNAAKIIAGEKAPETLGVRAVDDFTFEVSLSEPITYLPDMTVHYTMFPAPREAIETHGTDWTKPGHMVSNGAFQLDTWHLGEKLVAARNPHYRDNEATIIDRVVYLPIESSSAELQRYASGELHMTSTVPVSQMARLKKERPDELVMAPSIATYMYAFNVQRPPFDDVRVRRALTYAIDRNVIVNYITRGNQMPAYTLTPPYVSGFDFRQPEYATWSQTRRDEEARRELEKAGYNEDNPLEFELLYNTDESHKALAIVVSQMWKEKLGARVTISNLEWKTFLSEKQAGNYGMARFGWKGDYNEASTFLTLLTGDSGNNDGGWSNSEYDQLLKEARSSGDPNAYYARAEDILWQEFPVLPVYFNTTVALVSPVLRGYPKENPRNIIYSKDMYITAD